ncbi:MAG TPA: class I SAM-dependent methyltransferase [Arachidicoccus sp.]|nr:class I SAM-dependent methyltransferase [Arachidicoccus sp.]
MFSKYTLGKKYFQYLKSASNGKGHGIHSPFVYEFVRNVLGDRQSYPCYQPIEAMRRILKTDERVIEVEDFGAGSRVNPTNSRKIGAIASSALKPRKYSRLLFRMVQYFQSGTVLELGTCFGITTAYLASGHKNADVYTLEGASAIAEVARHNFNELRLPNVSLLQGNFDDQLPRLLERLKKQQKPLDFVFIDGNHRKEPTLRYFRELLPLLQEKSVVVFDDIHWSQEMEDAWREIRQHPEVTLSIDLFFIGIVFFRKENKVKQDFSIRF